MRSTWAAACNQQLFFILFFFFLISLRFLCSSAPAFSSLWIPFSTVMSSFVSAALDVVGSSAVELLLDSFPVGGSGDTDDFIQSFVANFSQNRFNYNVKTVHSVLSRAGTALSMEYLLQMHKQTHWRRHDLLRGGVKIDIRSWGSHGGLQGCSSSLRTNSFVTNVVLIECELLTFARLPLEC